MNEVNERPRIVFLGAPYGQIGGGMGSIMAYLASLGHDPSGRFRLLRLESRGQGSVLWSPFFLLKAVCRISAAAASGQLAVVHLNLAERGSVYRKAALLWATKAVGGKVLLHLHAAQITAEYDRMPSAGRWLLRGMFRSADRCVVLGEMWRTWLIKELGVSPDAVTIVRNGVPATPAPHTPRAIDAPFRLLFLGNLLERKGIADLLHALALDGAKQANLSLTVVGGGAVDHYRAMADSLGLKQRVHFTGWVDQSAARALVSESDALVLPAYDEGLPLVILEALASGVPVICTPVGAIPEVLTDGVTALFVTPGDRPAIASAILRLLRDAALQRNLADAGLKLYEATFTMTAFAERIGALYAMLARPGKDQVTLRNTVRSSGPKGLGVSDGSRP